MDTKVYCYKKDSGIRSPSLCSNWRWIFALKASDNAAVTRKKKHILACKLSKSDMEVIERKQKVKAVKVTFTVLMLTLTVFCGLALAAFGRDVAALTHSPACSAA